MRGGPCWKSRQFCQRRQPVVFEIVKDVKENKA